MNKQAKQAKRIIANVVDFDMHNLFPPMTPMENMEEAAGGDYVSQPKRTLRERPYTPNPIKVMPKYEGDFLDKLRERLEGKPVMPLETVVLSANPENLWDFKGPDEWLKHQQKPHPRNIVDQYYEMTKPGEGGGSDVLEDLYDRSWDNEDAPEISEDKITRMFKNPVGPSMNVPFHSASQRVASSYMYDQECSTPSSKVVLANFLSNCFVDFKLDLRKDKTAMLMKDLAQNASISTSKGTRSPGGASVTVNDKTGFITVGDTGVTVSHKTNIPDKGLWVFTTRSSTPPPKVPYSDSQWPWPYTTSFQFIPYGYVRRTPLLHVRVSCTCPSWIFWGAQYNSYMDDYLYGGIRPKFGKPGKRDKDGNFLVCKHVLACLPYVSKYKLGEVSEKQRKTLKKKPALKILPGIPGEILRIPKDLEHIALEPHIKEIEKNWDLSPKSRSSWIRKLEKPDELVYLSHRFPESSHLIAQRLKALTKIPEIAKKAEKGLEEVEEIEKKVPKIIVPPELESLGTNPDFIKGVADWGEKSDKDKKDFIFNEKSPDIVALVAFQHRDDAPTVGFVVERLKEIINNDDILDVDRERATNWEMRFLGGKPK